MTDAPGVRATSATYDGAAPRWGDKMRALGYHDGYLAFCAAHPPAGRRLVDVGAGTAAFSEAWVAVHGPPDEVALLDPSHAMLERGVAALRARGVAPRAVPGLLGEVDPGRFDEALAAHVIAHCPDPLRALRQLRDLVAPGGALRLVVSKPHWCNAIVWLRWRHRTFGRDEILALVGQAGLRVEGVFAFPGGPPSRTSRGILARRPQ